MERRHIDEMRSLVGAGTTEPVRTPEMAILEGAHVAPDFFGTRTLGWSEKRFAAAFFSITVCLRLYGVSLLTHAGRLLNRSEYPGAIWFTFSCDRERAEALMRAASTAGFEMQSVADDVYVVVGTETSEPLLLSVYLDHPDAVAPIAGAPRSGTGLGE